ncbi:MAG TPA: hypothetical protein DCM40_26305, partial [Maribacter sp.]|nr:hypothetical protein [Maribacter sp.]
YVLRTQEELEILRQEIFEQMMQEYNDQRAAHPMSMSLIPPKIEDVIIVPELMKKFVKYDPFTQTSDERLEDIANVLNLPSTSYKDDIKYKMNENLDYDLQPAIYDYNKIPGAEWIEDVGQNDFIRLKDNIYFVDHPSFNGMAKYVEFSPE